MNKVITIHLHGRAYQLEEPGYNKLNVYLDEAKSRLEQDPDKDEILADLEQAIGEKLDRFLNAHKTVVIESEVEIVLKEMGPVQSSATDGGGTSEQPESKPGSAKRLYQIPEGAMITGVCAGLAAYFNVDVTLVRIIFVVLTILTHGAWILVYLIMMIVVPHAKTSEQKAQAFGQPFTAQDLVNRARQEYSKFADKGEWKKWKAEFKQKVRQEKWEQKAKYYANYRPTIVTPFLGLLTAVLSILWIWGLVTLASTGMVFGLMVPAAIPLWVALLIWLCLYSFVMWPLKAARYAAYAGPNREANWDHYYDHPGSGFFETIVWLAFLAVIFWFAWRYIPAAHPYLDKVVTWGNHVLANIRHR